MSATALGQAAALAYADRHGRQPDGVWFAPGRVNLIGDLAAAGANLARSHQSLRDDFEVSWPQADAD
jgi:galactokinase